MTEIHPQRLLGRWDEGFALDVHTVQSAYAGDAAGHARFENTYTEVGGFIFRLKNQNDLGVLDDLVATAATFVRERRWPIDTVVPVPATKPRVQQPLLLLGQGISDTLGIPLADDAVAKVKATTQLKNAAPGTKSRLALLEDAFAVARPLIAGKRVLLLDDLYDSGATMKAITDRLYDEGGAAAVYALTFTITRTGTRTGARA